MPKCKEQFLLKLNCLDSEMGKMANFTVTNEANGSIAVFGLYLLNANTWYQKNIIFWFVSQFRISIA